VLSALSLCCSRGVKCFISLNIIHCFGKINWLLIAASTNNFIKCSTLELARLLVRLHFFMGKAWPHPKSETFVVTGTKLGTDNFIGENAHLAEIGSNRPDGGPFGEWVKYTLKFKKKFFLVCISAQFSRSVRHTNHKLIQTAKLFTLILAYCCSNCTQVWPWPCAQCFTRNISKSFP
jgi:hypothetical protein